MDLTATLQRCHVEFYKFGLPLACAVATGQECGGESPKKWIVRQMFRKTSFADRELLSFSVGCSTCRTTSQERAITFNQPRSYQLRTESNCHGPVGGQ